MTRRRLLPAGAIAALAVSLAVAPGAPAQEAPDVTAPDLRVVRGHALPDVELIDENGASFRISELFGKPTLISPIFTSCPHTCGFITVSLRDALAEIGAPEVGYHVLTISFDPADDPDALRAYREKMELPEGWRLAVASPGNLAALMEAIDFRWAPLEGGGFAHANAVAVIASDLTVSDYLHGVMYDPADVRAALEQAAEDASLLRKARPFLIGVMVLGALTMAAVLVVTRRRQEA